MRLPSRRWRLWLAIAVPAVALLVSAMLLIPRGRITEADYKRIKKPEQLLAISSSTYVLAQMHLKAMGEEPMVQAAATTSDPGDKGPRN